ncbi:MAG TPA: Hsp70 family protein, partial [Solirubrobacteraceae bacterium]|nr:Hsp70 family protein [Solirubrobacteraceae bacterium]
ITAGELAGLEVIATINEPTAAAIAYGLGKDESDQTVLVYDFGGGTFDVTVLKIANNEFTVMSTDGDSGLGGVDIDQRVADYLAEQFLTQRGSDLRADPFTKLDLMTRAEQAKKDLSGRQSVMVTLGSGREALRVDLDRSRLAELTGDLIERTRVCMERAVDAASLSWPQIDSVLLVGGSSRITAVREMIQQVCGKTVTLDVNPDEAVACGAAVRATLSDVREVCSEGPPATPADPGTPRPPEIGIVVRDVATHSLGVRAFSEDGKPINSIILPRFTELPCERQRTYATRADNQSQIEVEILQGDNPDPFSPEVESIGRLTMDDLLPRPAGGVLLALTLRYDVDGVVEVEAEELEGGRRLRQQLMRKSGELDPEVVEGLRRDLDELEQSDESASEERDQDGGGEGAGEDDDERPADAPGEDDPEQETGSSEVADEHEEPHEQEPSAGELSERLDEDGALTTPNYYELLGVEPSATEQELEAALEGYEHYWSERRDQASGTEEESVAEAGLATISDARATLLDPAARSRLDRDLGIGDGTSQGEGPSEAPQT